MLLPSSLLSTLTIIIAQCYNGGQLIAPPLIPAQSQLNQWQHFNRGQVRQHRLNVLYRRHLHQRLLPEAQDDYGQQR